MKSAKHHRAHPVAIRRSEPREVIYRRINELTPDPTNPRRHSRKQVRQIAESIKAFGFSVPILVDRDGNVIAGHGRLLATRQLGWSEVPTLCLDHLTPAQVRAFRIADNRLAEVATWDDRLLAEQLRDFSLLGLDFSIEVIGFEMAEIDLRIESLDNPRKGKDDPVDQMPELPADAALSKIGDLWILGDNRVLCGTALDSAAFTALMGEKRAAAAFTDPPDNGPIHSHASGLGAIDRRPCPVTSGERSGTEFIASLGQVFRNLAAFSIDGSLHYVCIDWRHAEELLVASRDVYDELKDLCVWVKDKSGRGSFYRNQHELIFVFKPRPRRAPQQRSTRPVQAQAQQCLALPRGQVSPPPQRGGQFVGAARDRKASGDGRRCNPRLLSPRRHRTRQLSRQRHDTDRRRAHWQALLRAGARPLSCRHDHPPLAGVDRRQRRSRHERPRL